MKPSGAANAVALSMKSPQQLTLPRLTALLDFQRAHTVSFGTYRQWDVSGTQLVAVGMLQGRVHMNGVLYDVSAVGSRTRSLPFSF